MNTTFKKKVVKERKKEEKAKSFKTCQNVS